MKDHHQVAHSRGVVFSALTTLLWASLLLGALPAQASSEEDPLYRARRYIRAAELCNSVQLKDRLYREAEELAREVLLENPREADAHFLLFASAGSRAMAKGPGLSTVIKMSPLRRHLDTALEINPQHAHALSVKGGILLRLPRLLGGNLDKALSYLKRAVELNPTGANTRLSLARALLKKGDRNGAKLNAQLAGHYACLTKRTPVLVAADKLLNSLAGSST